MESSHYLHGNTHIALNFLKVLIFFLVGYSTLKDFSFLFGAKFTGRKFKPVTSWQWTSRTVWDISRCSRQSICQSFFPVWIHNMIQIHSGETSRPRDFIVRSVVERLHALKLTSLTWTCEKSTYGKSNIAPYPISISVRPNTGSYIIEITWSSWVHLLLCDAPFPSLTLTLNM